MSRITNIQPKNNILGKDATVVDYTKDCNRVDVNNRKRKEIKKNSTFEQAFENAMTLDESRKRTLQHIDELWEKSK